MFGYPRTFEKRGADLALISFVGTPSMVDLASADSWGARRSEHAAVAARESRHRRPANCGTGHLDASDA